MSAFRTSMRRLPLSSALRTATINTVPSLRSFSTLPSRPLAAIPSRHLGLGAYRSLNSSTTLGLEASSPVADGGNTEPPESGINVDRSTSMDRLVSLPYMLSLDSEAGQTPEGVLGQESVGIRVQGIPWTDGIGGWQNTSRPPKPASATHGLAEN